MAAAVPLKLVGNKTKEFISGDTIADTFLASSFLKADGSIPLTANWVIGAFSIESKQTAATAATVYNGLLLTNSTAATVGNQMYSPYILMTTQGWSTTSVASQPVVARIGLQAIQGTTTPTWEFSIEGSLNGGAFGRPLLLTSAGVLTLANGGINAGGVVSSLRTALGSSVSDGIVSSNSTVAANNAQQNSGALRFRGNGWGTTGGASQTVDFNIYNNPIQGTVPTGQLVINSSINGAAATNIASITSAGKLSTTTYGFLNDTTAAVTARGTGFFCYNQGATEYWEFYNGGLQINTSANSGKVAFCNGSPSGVSADIAIGRNAAGILEVNTGTSGTFADLKIRSLIASGSISTAYLSKALSYTILTTDHTIEVTATGQTITLPTSIGASGREYIIKLTASGSCTVNTTSSQTIDGVTTYSLSAQYKYVHVKSNNANWLIVGNN